MARPCSQSGLNIRLPAAVSLLALMSAGLFHHSGGITPVNRIKIQLRATFTQQQCPSSGRNVVATDGLRIIRYIPFCFFSEKGQVLLAGVVLRKLTAHYRFSGEDFACEICVFFSSEHRLYSRLLPSCGCRAATVAGPLRMQGFALPVSSPGRS